MYNDKQLKAWILEFLIENSTVFDKLLKSKEWKQLVEVNKQLTDEITFNVEKEIEWVN